MNRTLVIGDIHGGLRALHQIMERAKVTTNDTLIFWEIMLTVGASRHRLLIIY